ncbi:hypothetical protein [Carboxylicivirga sp. M1479]|uniref:hypothetical protein n=1 Tax=Carboxylicivirga sp. M1479 TaxID=2594476 RepID=UPI001177EC91|nr:hypothetical protein [Carboxylicivirga sp. M1479]TRX70520.1 hypothetical protein FNN09_11115 [Carboxylicivirga sp. M1479]
METDSCKIWINQLGENIATIDTPYWETGDFYIALVVGLVSIGFSIMAYLEAKKAKNAANEAGKTVKTQSITIELTELTQKLDNINSGYSYQSVRDIYNELNRRIRRVVSVYKSDQEYSDLIKSILAVLDNTRKSLNGVRPTKTSQDETPAFIIFNATEGHFSDLNGKLAELIGLLEQRAIDKL